MKGMGGMQQMLKQANQMQRKMEKLQEELAAKTYTATAGGDGIKVTIVGDSKLQSIDVNPELQKESDTEMLCDLIMAATNEALKIAKEDHKAEMSKVTGGMGGLLGGLM